MYTATFTLNSTLDGRQAACPGEIVTYTCIVGRAVILEWTAEPFIMDRNRLQFTSTTPPGNSVLACGTSISPVQCAEFDYRATLTSVGAVQSGIADMTSTFSVTANTRLIGTVVQCRGLTVTTEHIASSTLNVTGIPEEYIFTGSSISYIDCF